MFFIFQLSKGENGRKTLLSEQTKIMSIVWVWNFRGTIRECWKSCSLNYFPNSGQMIKHFLLLFVSIENFFKTTLYRYLSQFECLLNNWFKIKVLAFFLKKWFYMNMISFQCDAIQWYILEGLVKYVITQKNFGILSFLN